MGSYCPYNALDDLAEDDPVDCTSLGEALPSEGQRERKEQRKREIQRKTR